MYGVKPIKLIIINIKNKDEIMSFIDFNKDVFVRDN
jgi:hypothetical protein